MSSAEAAQVGQRAPQYGRASVENARPHLLQMAPCRVRLTGPRGCGAAPRNVRPNWRVFRHGVPCLSRASHQGTHNEPTSPSRLNYAACGSACHNARRAVAQTAPAPLSIATDQGGDVYRFRVGEIRVTALSDGTVPQDLHQLLQRTTPARIDALLERNFQSNPVEASINAYLVELPERTVLSTLARASYSGLARAGSWLPASRVPARTRKITDVLIDRARFMANEPAGSSVERRGYYERHASMSIAGSHR